MFSRLLVLISLLLLTQASLAQQSQIPGDVPGTCPVTKASDQPFIPPWPHPQTPYPGGSWFGTDRLWMALPANGIWRAVRFSATDPGLGSKTDWWVEAKVSWWRQGYDWRVDGEPKLKVTGRRLDSPAPPLITDETNAVGRAPKAYMMVDISFPTLGCWEITGHYEGDDLTFVVWVAGPRWTEADRKAYLSRAQHGEVGAQFWLGAAYEQGWFGQADFEEALRWLRKAATHGDPDAQNALGQMYEDGEGVQQDYVLAAKWYRTAAEHVPDLGGAGQGRNNLGLLYLDGLGVPKDYEQAYMWFSLTNNETNLSHAKAQMTPDQVLEAERRAAEWRTHHVER